MADRFIDRFDVLLLDMGGTFMFDCDRFSEGEDFARTYREVGGRRLDADRVERVCRSLFDHMLSLARDPARYDDYPTVDRCLGALEVAKGLPERERALLEEVFLRHEMGTIPEGHAGAIRQLRRTHRLGLVSNIWSRSAPYLEALDGSGLKDLFDVLVFSSDVGSIKPGPRIFEAALAPFDTDRSRIAMVGNSHKRDVAGAKPVGLKAILIAPESAPLDRRYPEPDLVIGSLPELLTS
jgi:FMN phosphatase YigB (HAD superfamily)